jgi:hypothetical protein
MFLPLRLEIWDWRSNGSHVFVGSFQFSLNDIANNIKTTY